MAALAPLAVPAFFASTALTAGSQIMAGNEQKYASEFEASQLQGQKAQLEAQAENTRIQSAQDETRRREALTQNMETIQSIRAGRGVGQASPTGMSILDSLTTNGERDIDANRFNLTQRADAYRMSADNAELAAGLARRKGQMSMIGGYMGAGATLGSAAFKYGTAGKYGSGFSDPSRIGSLY